MNRFTRWSIACSLLVLFILSAPALLRSSSAAPEVGEAPEPPTLTVTGRATARATPDQAVLRIGAVVEAREASLAQEQVNAIVEDALARIGELGVPEKDLKTVDLSLTPVYERGRRDPARRETPRIVAYRARHHIQARLDRIDRVGPVIDAAVAAGANELSSLEFGVADDTEVRAEALREAVRDAKAKAQTIASALSVHFKGIHEVHEGGVVVMSPRLERMRALGAGAEASATPIEPGEVEVEATVTIRWRLAD